MTITDDDTEAMLARVRKLLAKAEDPAATAEESETYTAKASELMARHGIDRALLAASDPSLDVVGDRVVVLDRPYAAEKGQLVTEVALSLGCRVVRRTRYPGGVKQLSVHLFGHRCDLRRVEILFTSLLLQSSRDLSRTPVPPWDHPAAFRRSWLVGYAAAVGRRLARAEQAAAAEAEPAFTARGTTTSLVLADRSGAVEAARDSVYPDLRRARARQLSGSGHADGWAAGQRADLGGTPLSGDRRTLPR
jgi:hypothetical protein